MFEFAVRRPVSVTVIMLAFVVLGLYFGSKLSLELFPSMDIPIVTVVTVYSGAGPEEVEEQVSKKIEDQVGTVANLKELSSTSQDNISIVVAEFHYGTNMIEAVADVRDKVEMAKMNLPEDINQPIVSKVDPDSMAVMKIAFKGTTDLRTMRTIADDDIKKELEKVPGVASVTVSGGFEREISVLVDPGKLQQLGISPRGVVSAIELENLNVPAGNILGKLQQFQVRTVGQFQSVDDLKGIYIGESQGRRIYLKDIADVRDTNKEQSSVSRLDGVQTVMIQVRKNSDANIVAVCDGVRAETERINRSLPEGSELVIVDDNSDMIKSSVHAMEETAVEAMLLAILVIFLFLASGRSTIIVALSIPISIFSTFVVMHFCDLSLNLITLSAFTLAIGRVIDDSIVVLENIFRYIENGADPFTAAIDGTKEVGLAVLASTCTTIAVFLPILLISGIVGQIFKPLAITFMTALLVSLIVAVLLIPMMSARMLKPVDHHKPKSTYRKIVYSLTDLWNKGFEKLEKFYEVCLGWAIRHKFAVLFMALGLFLGSLFVFGLVPTSFSPDMDRKYVIVDLNTSVGSSLQKTDALVKRVEDLLWSDYKQYSEHYISEAGTAPGTYSMGSGSEQAEIGGVSLYLTKASTRNKSAMDIRDEIRTKLAHIPEINFKTTLGNMGPSTADVELVIKGDSLEELNLLAEKYKRLLPENIPGMSEVDLSWKTGKPEYRITVDRVKAGENGLNMYQIGSAVSTFVMGTQVKDINKYKEGGKDYDITVQLDRPSRDTIEKIKETPIYVDKDKSIPLWQVADVESDVAPSKITRKDRSRTISVQAGAAGRPASEIVKDVVAFMEKNPLPSGYQWEIGGEEEDRTEAFGDLFASLILAVFLVYIILAIQFESFIHPVTIMMAIPMELIGVSFTLLLTGEPVSMVVMLALILLTGIVVSNSILLVNYILVLRHEHGMSRTDAILKAGPTRLRPILMTAMATCIAMVPLALAMREGGEFFAPLGKVVIGGLLSSTVFTLLVIPCFYVLMDDLGNRLGIGEKENVKEDKAAAEAK